MKKLAFALIGALAFGFQQAPQSIVYVPRQGDKTILDVSVELRQGGRTSEVKSRIEETVEKIDAEGRATVKTRYLSVRSGDLDLGPRPEDTTVMEKDGTILTISGADADVFRVARTTLIPPFRPNQQTWSFLHPATKEPACPSAKTTLTLVGTEDVSGVPCVNVKYLFKEDGDAAKLLTAEGSFWLRVSDGRLQKLEAVLRNVPIRGETTDTVATVKVVSVNPEAPVPDKPVSSES